MSCADYKLIRSESSLASLKDQEIDELLGDFLVGVDRRVKAVVGDVLAIEFRVEGLVEVVEVDAFASHLSLIDDLALDIDRRLKDLFKLLDSGLIIGGCFHNRRTHALQRFDDILTAKHNVAVAAHFAAAKLLAENVNFFFHDRL